MLIGYSLVVQGLLTICGLKTTLLPTTVTSLSMSTVYFKHNPKVQF